jgi:manganese transport protein
VHGPAPALDLRLGVGVPAVPYGKVAIALDFSGRDADVIGSVLRFLGAQRPELALMHVVESAAARFLGGASGDVESRRDAERLEAYAAQLRSLGFPATVSMGAGKPVPELERMVKAFGAELLVVGAHGHRFLSDLVFGATADRLRHRVDATVLVVASRPEAGARTPS